MNTLIALGIMLSGYTLFALFYYLKNRTWNGFKSVEKNIVAIAIVIILSIMLVNVPEVAGSLKVLTGLDVNIESSKVGFITLGFAIAALLASNHSSSHQSKKRKDTANEKE